MTSTKERKTATITIKVTPKFKEELINLANNDNSSQTVVLENAFNSYVDVWAHKQVECGFDALYNRLEPYCKKHPEIDKLNIIKAVSTGFSTKALLSLCDPTQCDDDTFQAIIDVKIRVAKKSGVYDNPDSDL